jgi:hypothetical protein
MKAGLWSEILDRLEDQYGEFEVEKLSETREDDTGQKLTSEIERVDFETPMGRMRVELVTAPMILDKKTHYTHTAGARANVEYVLSDTEKTQKIRAFRFDEDTDDFIEINTSPGFLG